jgi:hypothetical protein
VTSSSSRSPALCVAITSFGVTKTDRRDASVWRVSIRPASVNEPARSIAAACSDPGRKGDRPGAALTSPPTEHLRNGGTLETAQEIAAHESSRTTKLYDRSQGEITLDEIERIPAV